MPFKNGDNGSVSKAKSVAWGTGLSWGTAVKLGSDSGSAITGMCDCGGEVAVTKQEGFYFVKNNIVTKGTVDFSQQFTWQAGRRPCLVTPFLVIPYGNRIQRYYNEVCESFGPEMNGSLPMEYEGEVMDSKPLLAAVFAPATNEFFFAREGHGADAMRNLHLTINVQK